MRGRRSGGAIVGVLVAVAVAGAASAWACSAQAWVSARPDYGSAGSVATITGAGFYQGAVSVHWGDRWGPVLATAAGPDFTVDVTIPADAVADVHVIQVLGNGTSASLTFEVVPVGGQRTTTSPTERSTNQATTGGRSTSGASSPAAQPGDSTSSSPANAAGSGGSGAVAFPSPNPSTQPAGEPASSATPATPANAAASVSPVPSAGAVAVPAPSSRPAGERTPAAATAVGGAAAPADREAVPAGSSLSAASGDLWSGFAPGSPSERGASLSGAHATGPADSSPLAVGAVLFVLGLAALGAGFGVAEVRRARAGQQVR